MSQIRVTLEPEDHRWLREQAAREDVSVDDLLTRAIHLLRDLRDAELDDDAGDDDADVDYGLDEDAVFVTARSARTHDTPVVLD